MLSEPKKFDERNLLEQIEYLFDTSSDKKLLLQDCLNAINTKRQKIQNKIDEYKKQVMDDCWWAKSWKEVEEWYENEFPDSDNHGDTAFISGTMSSINELTEILNELGEKRE